VTFWWWWSCNDLRQYLTTTHPQSCFRRRIVNPSVGRWTHSDPLSVAVRLKRDWSLWVPILNDTSVYESVLLIWSAAALCWQVCLIATGCVLATNTTLEKMNTVPHGGAVTWIECISVGLGTPRNKIRKDMELSNRGLPFSWRDPGKRRNPWPGRDSEYLPNTRPKRDLCAIPSVHSNYSVSRSNWGRRRRME
jgi:hypothetical protein